MNFNNAMPSWKQAMYPPRGRQKAEEKKASTEQSKPEEETSLPVLDGNQRSASNNNGLLVENISQTNATQAVYSLVANGIYDLAALMASQGLIRINVKGNNLTDTSITGADDKEHQVFLEGDHSTVTFTGGSLNDVTGVWGKDSHLTAVLGGGNDIFYGNGQEGSSADIDMGIGDDYASIYFNNSNYVFNLGEGQDSARLGWATNTTSEIFLGNDTDKDTFFIDNESSLQTNNTVTLHGDGNDLLNFTGDSNVWPKDNTFFKFSTQGSNKVIEFGDGNKVVLDGVNKVKVAFDDGMIFEGTVDELNLLLNPLPTGPDPNDVYNYISTNPSIHDNVGGPLQPNVGDASKHYWNFDLKNGNDVFNPYISTMQNKFVTIDAGTGNDSIYFTNSQYKNNEIDVKLGEGADKFMLGNVSGTTGDVDLGVDNDQDIVQLSNMALQKDNQLTLKGDAKDLVNIPANDLTTITGLTQLDSGEWKLEYGNNNALTIPADMKFRVGNTDRTLQEFMDYLIAQNLI